MKDLRVKECNACVRVSKALLLKLPNMQHGRFGLSDFRIHIKLRLHAEILS